MSKIVVFGGNGFIGKHLVRALSENKNDEIYVFDRFSESQALGRTVFDNIDNVHAISGNFFNRNEVSEVLKNAEYVFHLISTTNPAASHNDPLIDVDTNIRSSVELFQMCVESGIKKVIFLSSGGTVYGDIDNDKINELALPKPLSPYGIGKLTVEHYLKYFQHTHGLDYIVYRVANPYGPGQNLEGKQGVIPIFMNQYIKKGSLTIYGDGSMTRDYIYIDDLVNMIVGSFRHNGLHSTYNLGSGAGVSINDLVGEIENCAKFRIEKQYIEAPSSYIQDSVLDITRFIHDYGISPVTTLKDGIKKTWSYVNEISH